MRLPRFLAGLLLVAALAACAEEKGAAPYQIDQARHVSDEEPYIALVSMVNRKDEKAAHSALIINASQRVIYDPAGTFQHPELVERGDIHYGATDRMVDYYKRYHARFSHYVHEQRIRVPYEIAELALQRAQAQGPSPKMFCTQHTIAILNDVPGLPDFKPTFFPENLRREVARIPGVIDAYVYEQDDGKNVPDA